MRALVIQHDHVSPHGPIGERLAEHGYTLEEHLVVEEDNFHRPHLHNPFPTLEGIDLVVSMGAPWSAYDDATVGAWVKPELDLLRAADDAGIPVLGICFGGQLLAAAHGGEVHAAPAVEIGWTEIETDAPDLVPSGPWFEWHSDRWVTPADAREVARNQVGPQAFVLRKNLALQFHPELTLEMLQGWFANGGDVKATEAGFDVDELTRSTVQNNDAARARAHALVDAFIDQVVTPQA